MFDMKDIVILDERIFYWNRDENIFFEVILKSMKTRFLPEGVIETFLTRVSNRVLDTKNDNVK